MSWTLSAFTDEAGASCEEQIAAAKRAGLNFLDIRAVDGHNISVLPIEVAREVKAKLDAAGIKVQMFGSPLGKIDIADDQESDLTKLRHMAELAPVLGCNQIRIFSYYNKAEVPLADWAAESLKRLSILRAEAATLGLVLFHENERHIFGDYVANVLQIAELRDDNFKLIFDFDNYNQNGEDVWDNWTQLKDLTDSFHLKDSKKGESGYQHVPIGQGDGQAKKILTDAVSRGWSGPIALEPHLSHSAAVAATGPSGQQNEAFGTMPIADSFHVAAETAKTLLQEIGAEVG